MFYRQGHDIKIYKAIRRIKNFHVATDWPAALRQRFPIETAHALVEAFADRIAGINSKQIAGRIVEISDPAFRIGNDDSFLNGVEDGLEKTFLLRQSQEIILHLFRPNPAESLDYFFKKTRFHDVGRDVNWWKRVNCCGEKSSSPI